MVAVAASNLSDPKYGYDFVVATTQASINSDLLAYLAEGKQPVQYICFLADPQTGNPSQQISLDDLQNKSGVNPFDIPDGTDYGDPRITALTNALFICGVKIQMGLPPGVMPKSLTPVTLGSSANNVLFNMYCSQFEVIQNSPPSGFGGKGAWNVWSQSPGTPWYVSTRVNLVVADLDKELDTPYFQNHPDQQAAIKAKLINLSASAFSLQQLLYDLDNAVVQSVPTFGGIPSGSNADSILQKSFISIYSAAAKQYGQPLVSVTAVSHDPEPSPLDLTGYEREVSPLVDGGGVQIQNPSALQQSATTLDYLCTSGNNPLPGASSFGWNWVDPQDIGNESGVIAISRKAIGTYFLQQLMPSVKPYCIAATTSVDAHALGKVDYSWTLTTGQTPQIAQVTPAGPDVITIAWSNSSEADDKSGATYGQLKIQPNYTCSVSFSDTTITIVQRLWIYVYAQWDDTGDGNNVFDKTITDTYTISVGQNGNIVMTHTNSNTQDDSKGADRSGFVNFWTGIDDLLNDIKNKVGAFASPNFNSLPIGQMQSFVFPGAKVFTYAAPSFSNYQDLVCNITYAAPS